MKKTYIILAILLICLTISCRKQMPNLDDNSKPSPATLIAEFDLFWNGVNNNYVFWDIDTTDWDAVYEKYRPLFQKLDTDQDDLETKIAEYLHEMTKGMVDSHMSILLKPSTKIFPAFSRYKESPNYRPQLKPKYFEMTMSNNYLDPGFIVAKDPDLTNPGNAVPLFTVSGTVGNDIAYLYLSTFRLHLLSSDSPVLANISKFFNLAKRSNTKGVILDLRSNTGGYVLDMNLIAANLISEKYLIGYTRGKGGVGRLDYTPWVPEYLIPSDTSTKLTVPIVVLADHYSASMSELTVAAIKLLPNGHFVGERTWGAEGPLMGLFNSNAGSFTTQMLNVDMASRAFKFADGTIYEGVGLSPDIEVLHNKEKFAAGIDTQLERAVQLIKTGK